LLASKHIYDFIIVGCGPVGASLANLLAQYGHTVAIFETSNTIYPHPRAVHIDDEVMRIFQSMQLDQSIKAHCKPFESMQFVDNVGNITLELAVANPKKPYGHASAYWFKQPELEAILRQNFQRFPKLDFYTAHRVQLIEQQQHWVQAKIVNAKTQKHFKVQSSYLIACDGAKSGIRKQLGITLTSLHFKQSWIVIDTLLKNAADAVLLPNTHQQICHYQRPSTYVPGVGLHRRWEFMLHEKEVQNISDEKGITLLSKYINPQKVRILRQSVYQFHALLAQKWQQGRVFLAGDAAHQMPPFAGQGMCSGIRDVQNLAWKLHLVLNKQAASTLLHTYQQERYPHVLAMTKGAMTIGKVVQTQNKYVGAWVKMVFSLAQNWSYLKHLLYTLGVRKHALQKGIIGKHKHLRGQLFIQPLITNKQRQITLLDNVLSHRFVLLSKVEVPPTIIQQLSRLPVDFYHFPTHFSDFNDILQSWFTKNKVDFVLLRPDSYIFDAGNMRILPEVINHLRQLLTQ